MTKLIWGGVIVACAYFVRDSLIAFAGKRTEVNSVLQAVANLSVNEYAAWVVSAVTGVAWFKERSNRRRLIKQLGPYAAELEKKLGPERTGSGLLADGQQKRSDTDA
jgi:hypothetical protein